MYSILQADQSCRQKLAAWPDQTGRDSRILSHGIRDQVALVVAQCSLDVYAARLRDHPTCDLTMFQLGQYAQFH